MSASTVVSATTATTATTLAATDASMTRAGSSTIGRATLMQVDECMNGWAQLKLVARNAGTVFTYQLDNGGRTCDNALGLVQADEQAGATGQPVKVLALVVAALADAIRRASTAVTASHCAGKCSLTAASDPKALELILPPGPGYDRLRAKVAGRAPGLLNVLDVDGINVG